MAEVNLADPEKRIINQVPAVAVAGTGATALLATDADEAAHVSQINVTNRDERFHILRLSYTRVGVVGYKVLKDVRMPRRKALGMSVNILEGAPLQLPEETTLYVETIANWGGADGAINGLDCSASWAKILPPA